MDAANPLQQLLLRGLGTTTLVAERLRGVTQNWVSSGRLDPNEASALVDDVLKALRGETPELEQQMGRNLERNRDTCSRTSAFQARRKWMSCAAALIASSNSCGR